MTVRAARGAKRRCQNEECGRPFYDLNRPAPVCPDCGAPFDTGLGALQLRSAETGWPARRPARFFALPGTPKRPSPVEEVELHRAAPEAGETEAQPDADQPGAEIVDVILEEDEPDEGIDIEEIPGKRDDE